MRWDWKLSRRGQRMIPRSYSLSWSRTPLQTTNSGLVSSPRLSQSQMASAGLIMDYIHRHCPSWNRAARYALLKHPHSSSQLLSQLQAFPVNFTIALGTLISMDRLLMNFVLEPWDHFGNLVKNFQCMARFLLLICNHERLKHIIENTS